MFYKCEGQNLMYGPTVQFPSGEYLSVDTMDQYTLPLYDWYYFATEEEAKTFFNIND